MAKLIRYADGKTACWSRVDLPNGDPIWISVAQTGVVVKKSRLGFTGATLYSESDAHNAAQVSLALDLHVSHYITPPEMVNPLLRAFTQAALECQSALQLSHRLNEAGKSHRVSHPPSQVNRQKARIRQQVIAEYGHFLTANPMAFEIRDVSQLPHPREEILEALILELVQERSEQRIEALEAGALLLADFQVNVGPTPLTTLGVTDAEIRNGVGNSDNLKDLAAKIAHNPNQERYEAFRKKADDDLAKIQNQLVAAQAMRMQLSGTEKRQTLEVAENPLAEDVTRWKQGLADLSRDRLTGLHSRREFERQVETFKVLQQGRAHVETVTLVCVNLDRLKMLNEGLGRAAGDSVLRHVATLLHKQVGGRQLVARNGGDQFGVWLPGTPLAEGIELAERIRRAVETEAWHWNGSRYPVTVSCGVAAYPENVGDVANLYRTADAALFEAKQAGRNRVHQAVTDLG